MPTAQPTPRNSRKKKPAITVPLADKAYIAIKKMILTHQLTPGEHINVAILCETLSLGRSPIHLAIHRLDREGLVEILPRKGILVKAETLDGFLDLIASRQLVEPYLTGLAVEHSTPELLSRLKQLIEAGKERHRNNDRYGAMEIDRLFHQTLYEAANNKLLADFAAQLLDRSVRLWFRPLTDRSEPANTDELERLYAEIERGDKDAAIQRMQEHIGSIQQKYLG